MNTLNINLGSQPNTFRPGGSPFGAPNFLPGYTPMGDNWENPNSCHESHGGCDSKKKDKKDKGLIGNLLTAVFGSDSILGKLFGLDDKKKKKDRCGDRHDHGRDHGRGANNIAINISRGSASFGF